MSAIIVIAVFMQPQKIQVAMSLMVVGQKHYLNVVTRGFEAFMQRFTGIMVFLWIVDAIVLSILSSK